MPGETDHHLEGRSHGRRRRAAASHTASMAGQKTIWDALFRQTGAISVDSLDEMAETTYCFLTYSPCPACRPLSSAWVAGPRSPTETSARARAGCSGSLTRDDRRTIRVHSAREPRDCNPSTSWRRLQSASVGEDLSCVEQRSCDRCHTPECPVAHVLGRLEGFWTRS